MPWTTTGDNCWPELRGTAILTCAGAGKKEKKNCYRDLAVETRAQLAFCCRRSLSRILLLAVISCRACCCRCCSSPAICAETEILGRESCSSLLFTEEMNSSALNPPFTVVSASDNSGLLWITAALSLTYFMLSCAIRVFINYQTFHRDATMLVVATVTLPTQASQPTANFEMCLGVWTRSSYDRVCPAFLRVWQSRAVVEFFPDSGNPKGMTWLLFQRKRLRHGRSYRLDMLVISFLFWL